jgi:hypothetical protein
LEYLRWDGNVDFGEIDYIRDYIRMYLPLELLILGLPKFELVE